MSYKIGLICLLCLSMLFVKSYLYKKLILTLLLLIFLPDYLNILYFVIGFILAPCVTNIVIGMLYRNVKKLNYGFKLDEKTILDAVAEELVWRELFVQFLAPSISVWGQLLIGGTLLILFVKMHKVKEKRKICEMTIFTTFLYMTAFLFPGMNYGLHCGRNCFIDNKACEKEYNE